MNSNALNTNIAHERRKRKGNRYLVPSVTSDYDFEVMTIVIGFCTVVSVSLRFDNTFIG